MSKSVIKALLFGLASAALYFLLFMYSDDIRTFAENTNAGDKAYFLVPIVIAFVFSIIHGAFTGHFWDALGVKAKK